MTPEGWLVVVDLQHVFGDADSPWAAPRFARDPAPRPAARRRPSATAWCGPGSSRRPAPAGAWKEYYEQFPFALQPPDAPLYQLVDDPGAHPVVDATTFGKWGPDLAAVVGDGPLTVVGVATDCCVISTVLPAADAGVPVPGGHRRLRRLRRRRPRARAAGDEPLRAAGDADDDGRGPRRPMIPAAGRDVRLPDGFVVRLDPRVRRRPDGALLGGSPLRLLRLSAAGAGPAGRRPARRPGRHHRRARRPAARRRARRPRPARPAPPDDVTVVIPVKDRPGRARPAAGGAARGPGDRGPAGRRGGRRLRGPGARRRRRPRAAARRSPAARPRRATPGCGRRPPPFVAFLDSDCVPAPRLARAAAAAPGRPAAGGRRAADRRARRAGGAGSAPYEAAVSALDMGPHPAAVRPLSAVSYVPSAALLARRDGAGRRVRRGDARGRGRRPGLAADRAPAGGCATSRPPRSRTSTRPRTAAWLRRRAFYGTGAALLAARHGERGRAAGARAGVRAGLGAGGRRRAAGRAAAAAGRARGHRRPAGPPAGPARRAAARWRSPRRSSLRGQAASGRALARSVTRHHWPLALAAAAVSRRARRGVLAVAAADAVAAWWPHRQRVGPVRFAAARRLEDLAYGAGLWWGAVRAREPARAAPGPPAALTANHTPDGRNDRPVPRLVALCTAVRASVGPRENFDRTRDLMTAIQERPDRPPRADPAPPVRAARAWPAPRSCWARFVAIGPLTIDMYLPALPTHHPRARDDVGGGAADPDRHPRRARAGPAGARPAVGRLGRRRPLLAGTALHVLASLLVLVAPNLAVLGALRVLQGVGHGGRRGHRLAIVRDLYDGRAAATMLSRLFLVLGAAPVLAPTIGGELLRFTSWRGIFALLAVYGVADARGRRPGAAGDAAPGAAAEQRRAGHAARLPRPLPRPRLRRPGAGRRAHDGRPVQLRLRARPSSTRASSASTSSSSACSSAPAPSG